MQRLRSVTGFGWIFNNKIAFDTFSGIGMGFLNRTNTGTEIIFNNSGYGNYVGQSGLATNMGLNIGFLGK